MNPRLWRIWRRGQLAAASIFSLLLCGCLAGHSDGATTTYSVRPVFYCVILGGMLLAALLGWLLVQSDPGQIEGYLFVLMPLVGVLALWTAMRNTWVLTPDSFTPPSGRTKLVATIRYDQIDRLEILTEGNPKGRLRFWDVHLRGIGVERINRPDEPVSTEIERQIRQRKIVVSVRQEAAGSSTLRFAGMVLGGCAMYFATAASLAIWARQRMRRRKGG